jgi:hypothetical protein
MRSKLVFTSVVVFLVITAFILVFVFKASGSNSSVSVEGCDPYNVEVKKGEKGNSVNIYWKTKSNCSGYIIYGSEMKDLHLVGIDLVNEIKDVNHSVEINSLISTKMYYFSIVSDGISYGKDGLPISFMISSL